MADNPLKITVPCDQGEVSGAQEGQPFFLPVSGTDVAGNKVQITGAILSENGKPLNVNTQIPIQPPSWLVVFEVDAVHLKSTYTVEIIDSLSNPAACSFAFKSKDKDADSKYDITPASGTSVPGSGFAVRFPNPGNGLACYAFIGQPGGPSYFGTPVQQSPDEIWAFQNIPPGLSYTITVVVYSNPPSYTTSTNITVT